MSEYFILIGAPHPSLYSPVGGVIHRVVYNVGFLVHYKEIYHIELVSKYNLLCLIFQVDEVSRLGWASRLGYLCASIILRLFSIE